MLSVDNLKCGKHAAKVQRLYDTPTWDVLYQIPLSQTDLCTGNLQALQSSLQADLRKWTLTSVGSREACWILLVLWGFQKTLLQCSIVEQTHLGPSDLESNLGESCWIPMCVWMNRLVLIRLWPKWGSFLRTCVESVSASWPCSAQVPLSFDGRSASLASKQDWVITPPSHGYVGIQPS